MTDSSSAVALRQLVKKWRTWPSMVRSGNILRVNNAYEHCANELEAVLASLAGPETPSPASPRDWEAEAREQL